MLTITAGYFNVVCEHPAHEVAAICEIYATNQPEGPTEVTHENGSRYRLTDVEWDATTRILTATMWRVRESNLPALLPDTGEIEQVPSNLGEPASFAYCPERRRALIQYNHHGPRHPIVSRFLTEIGIPSVVMLTPEITPDALRRIELANQVRRIEFTLRDGPGMEAIRGIGVAASIDQMSSVGGTTIKVEISAGRGSGGLVEGAKQLARQLALAGDSVVSIKAGVRRTEESAMEVLDLLGGRLVVDLAVDEAGRELDRAKCRARLRTALHEGMINSNEVDDVFEEPEE